MSAVLLLAPERSVRDRIDEHLRSFSYLVQTAVTIEDVRRMSALFVYDVLVADVDNSLGLLREIVSFREETTPESGLIVLISPGLLAGAPDLETEAHFDVIERPFSTDRLRMHVVHVLEARRLQYEMQSLRHERGLIHNTSGFVAVSKRTKDVLALARKVSQSDSTALLTGETGTGKELVAGAIHYGSKRADGPFVKLNCAALPSDLLESELFGHEKGAFTGASRMRTGRFEHANTGTIFLDEIGDMSMETQAKVLRVVQEREFQRLGSNRTIRTDVRIIAATNKSLSNLVAAGEFREDLFYRLNVIAIDVPPLRERREDILPLVEFFLNKLSGDLKKPVKSFSPDAMEAMLAHSWPGNIRELRNIVERGVLLSESDTISLADIGLGSERAIPDDSPVAGTKTTESRPGDESVPRKPTSLKESERHLIIEALERCDWVQKDAAVILGVSTRVLNHKIRRFGIKHPSWRRNS